MSAYILCLVLLFSACDNSDKEEVAENRMDTGTESTSLPTSTNATNIGAVNAVSVTGEEKEYVFTVTISSPDTGCDQYADWWEVLSPEGRLIHRRVLLHSHVKEQPFSRSGSPIPVQADTEVIVRMHMNNSGYSRAAMQGSVSTGFTKIELTEDFALELAEQEPKPTGCSF